jgi:hypothetical protein
MKFPNDFEAQANPARLQQQDIQELIDLALNADQDCIVSSGNALVAVQQGKVIVATEYVIAAIK